MRLSTMRRLMSRTTSFEAPCARLRLVASI
jgi:hypothetical protein